MFHEAQKMLEKYFGYSSFRKGQEEAIKSILEGQDTLCIMPTGSGKSVCYQIPALLLPGITLVISPLISLMKDQVDALNNLGIASTFINSSLNQTEIENRIAATFKGNYNILYIAPERLESERFKALLKNLPISLLAIDEAHCVSQWGHDFRPTYISIAPLIKELSRRPVVAAFTATATPDVKQDIVKLLDLETPDIYVTGFDRENLSFSVVRGTNKLNFVIDYLDAHKNQPGIIYAATRKEVDRICDYLHKKGFPAGKYHAGMSDIERVQSQEAFIFDNILVMVATNAFGMGIDKSNVRYVLHFNMPKNMESYYQEAGRCGRDGEPGECVLLYGGTDIHIQKFLIEQTAQSPERKSCEYKKLQAIVDFCHTSQCLRKYILKYFGESYTPNSCDNCSSCNDDGELSDITIEAQKIFSCIKRMGERFGINLTAGVLRGANSQKIHQLGFNKLSTYGIMKEYPLREITDIINLLVAEDYLYMTEGQYPVVKLTKKAFSVLNNEEKVLKKVQKPKQIANTDLSLFDLLRSLRKEISVKENVPPYIIFHDSTLQEMSKYCPTDRKSMFRISGIGEAKFQKYGLQFIEVIKKYVEEHRITPAPQKEISAESNDTRTPSHAVTYEMYEQGKTLEQITGERKLTLITIQEHLVRCWNEGYEIDWSKFINPEHEVLVLQAVKEVGRERLRPIKDVLPDEVDYFTIRAVLCKHQDKL